MHAHAHTRTHTHTHTHAHTHTHTHTHSHTPTHTHTLTHTNTHTLTLTHTNTHTHTHTHTGAQPANQASEGHFGGPAAKTFKISDIFKEIPSNLRRNLMHALEKEKDSDDDEVSTLKNLKNLS